MELSEEKLGTCFVGIYNTSSSSLLHPLSTLVYSRVFVSFPLSYLSQ